MSAIKGGLAAAALVLALAGGAQAQGLFEGARQGAARGDRAAGPIGGIVGGAVGAGVGAVNGALGIGPRPARKVHRHRHVRRYR